MNSTSRRSFLERSALALSSAGLAFRSPAPALENIGVQLYTVRSILGAKPAETLQALDQIGYREVEIAGASIDAIWTELTKTRLKAVSTHVDSALFSLENASKLTAAISRSKELGIQYVVYPYLPPNQRGGLDAFKALADALNRAGELCRKAGLGFCYHNHAFEFEPMGATTGMETLLNQTDKALVGWELDVFWVSVGGHDPAEMIRQHAGRVHLVHLKDKAQGTPVQYNESLPRTAFKEVGHGSLDFPGILRAAKAAGVRHYFVEQDETPADPIESLRQSFDYLRTVQNKS